MGENFPSVRVKHHRHTGISVVYSFKDHFACKRVSLKREYTVLVKQLNGFNYFVVISLISWDVFRIRIPNYFP